MIRPLALALLLFAGSAALSADRPPSKQDVRDAARLSRALAGLVPAEPVQCLPHSARRDDVQRFGNTLLYRTSSREVYRTDTGGGCPGLSRGDIIVTRTTTGTLCSGDIIETVVPTGGMPSGVCAFGQFTPYRKR